MIIVVPKIGDGRDTANAIRPDTDAIKWSVIEERETEFVIEVFDD